MKKVAIFFLMLMSLTGYAQKDRTHDVSVITGTDTCYVIPLFGTNTATLVQFEFTDFDTSTATLTVYYLFKTSTDTIPLIADNLNISSSDFPVILDNEIGSDYMNIWNSDTTYAFGINADYWKGDMLGYKLILNDVTTGHLNVRVRK